MLHPKDFVISSPQVTSAGMPVLLVAYDPGAAWPEPSPGTFTGWTFLHTLDAKEVENADDLTYYWVESIDLDEAAVELIERAAIGMFIRETPYSSFERLDD